MTSTKFLEIKITEYRTANTKFIECFSEENSLVFCNDVSKLFHLFGYPHHPDEWRLFIDSSYSALKAVLLHNGNEQPTVPVAYSTTMNETYDVMKFLLEKINYAEHKWKICADLKVVAILMGIQSGNVKYPCFLCTWDSRAREKHYKTESWPPRQTHELGEHNIIKTKLVDKNAIIFPPLHIMLGLMTQFMKTVDEENPGKKRIYDMFPKLTPAKIIAGIFIGPDVLRILNDDEFYNNLPRKHQAALMALKDVVENFLGNERAVNYRALIQKLLNSYEAINANMSLKLHFLKNHLDNFVDNLGAYSDQHGERFHQDIKNMERKYKGKDYKNMLGDHCWRLIREDPNTNWSRKSRQNYFNKQ